MLSEYIIPSLQMLSVILLFLGLVLLNDEVRAALTEIYARLYIRHVADTKADYTRRLAVSLGKFLYCRASGAISPVKTFTLASFSFALVAIRIAPAKLFYGSAECDPVGGRQLNYFGLMWNGERPDLSVVPDFPSTCAAMALDSSNTYWALPVTFAFHWLGELVAGYLFVRTVTRTPKFSVIKVTIVLLLFLSTFVIAPPILLIIIEQVFLWIGLPPSWDSIFFMFSVFATGPGLLLGFWPPEALNSSGTVDRKTFAIGMLSSLTFASGLLAILFASTSARSRVILTGITWLIQGGRGKAVAIILFSATSFGFLTDISTSLPSIASALSKAYFWLSSPD